MEAAQSIHSRTVSDGPSPERQASPPTLKKSRDDSVPVSDPAPLNSSRSLKKSSTKERESSSSKGKEKERDSTASPEGSPDKASKKKSSFFSSLKNIGKSKSKRTSLASSSERVSSSGERVEPMEDQDDAHISEDDKERVPRDEGSSSEEEDSPRPPRPPTSTETSKRHEEEYALWRVMSQLHPERKVDDAYYLLAVPWLKQWSSYWQRFERGKPNRSLPGPIDNSGLFQDVEKQVLRFGMSKRYDYRLVSEPQWLQLHAWYGGGPAIKRHVIPIGTSALTKVEVYLLNLTVMMTTSSGRIDQSTSKEMTVSRRMSIGDFRRAAADLFSIDPKMTRLWNFFSQSSEHPMDNDANTLGEEGIVHGQTIVVQQLKKGEVKKGITLPIFNKKQVTETKKNSLVGKRRHRGCCGLEVWGSSPLLNSLVQCLSNTQPFCEYFLNNLHAEIPTLERFGADMAALLQSLWSVEFQNNTPSCRLLYQQLQPNLAEYKRAHPDLPMVKVMLDVLMDMLHSDLNRANAITEAETSGDASLSLTASSSSILKNDSKTSLSYSVDLRNADLAQTTALLECNSIISDVFMGQLKVSRKCTTCQSKYVNFEPFTAVTVPVAKSLSNLLFFEVPFLRLHDSMCALKYGVHVPFGASVKDMKVALATLAKVDASTIQFISVNHQRSFKVLEDDLVQSDFPKRQLLIAYEFPANADEYYQIRVLHRKLISSVKSGGRRYKIYGVPFMVFVPKNRDVPSSSPSSTSSSSAASASAPSALEVYEKVWECCKRFISLPIEAPGTKESYKTRILNRCKAPFDAKSPHFVLSMLNDSGESCGSPSCSMVKRSLTATAPVAPSDSSSSSSSSNSNAKYSFSNASGPYCAGCTLAMADKVDANLVLAVDWDPEFRKERYNEDEVLSVHVLKEVLQYRAELTQPLPLDSCFQNMSQPEHVLQSTSAWRCDHCKDIRAYHKTSELWRLPEVLVIHLQRLPAKNFDPQHPNYNLYSQTTVDFPLKGLNLARFVNNPTMKTYSYDIFAVMNTDPDLLDSQASAFCCNKNDKYWYLFKDRSVRRSYDLTKLQTKRSSVLFYRKSQNSPAGAWKSLKQICEENISGNLLLPDNAVVLFQHACAAQAEIIKMRCVQTILSNLDASLRDLPAEAIMQTEARELCDIISKADLDRRGTFMLEKKENTEGFCALCDRNDKKKLYPCGLCKRPVCRKCSERLLADDHSYCNSCKNLVKFTF